MNQQELKQQYLEGRNSHTLDIEAVHYYFVLKGGKNFPVVLFRKYFVHWIEWLDRQHFGQGDRMLNHIIITLDTFFEITVASGKDGKFLKAW